MRWLTPLVVALRLSMAWAFVLPETPARRALGRRALVVDPSVASLAQQTMLLADEQLSSGGLAVAKEIPADFPAVPAPVVETAAAATTEAAQKGWFDGIVWVVEQGIQTLHGVLGDGSYGVSIIMFTLIIKAVTLPLNYAQIESTTRMQQLQPAIKMIQAKYSNDPQQANLMMAQLYEENNLNPLAGCLPALVQIPVFIALYRALLSLAKEDLLEESFLWLPSLEGPVFGAQNADWLLKFDQWTNGAPPLGWHDTLAYLSLPAVLIVAQTISTKLLQPPVDPNNEQAQTSNAVLRVLPVMVGFFALNVPSGLCVYWIVNNIFTTASTLLIRRNVLAATGPATMGGAAIADAPPASLPRKASKSRVAEPKTFDDMLAPPPKSKTPTTVDVQPTIDVVPESTVAIEAEEGVAAAQPAGAAATRSEEEYAALSQQPRSKSAQKKLAKASKSRRSKKSRR